MNFQGAGIILDSRGYWTVLPVVGCPFAKGPDPVTGLDVYVPTEARITGRFDTFEQARMLVSAWIRRN